MFRMRPFLFAGLLVGMFLGAAAGAPGAPAAGAAEFRSGVGQVALIELYTSEGCSSCPPAERWLAALKEKSGLWSEFVPIAFHVDYWNRLGWPDKFSKKEFTDREYAYSAAWRSESVYTPCVVRDGREWKQRGVEPGVPRTAGILSASYDGAVVRIKFEPEAPPAAGTGAGETWEIHAALLGGGIASKIGAGENRGATLHHEFVALALADGALNAPLPLARAKVAGVEHYALAVWVTRRGELAPVQATGGWLDAAPVADR